MIRMVVAVAAAAMSRVPGLPASAVAAARAKTGTSASIAAGAKLAATILRWSRHSSPSEESRPRPIVAREQSS